MDRRSILGMMGASAVGVAFAGRDAIADDGHDHNAMIHEACLKACSDCAKSCDETFHHCIVMLAEGKKEHAASAHLLSDCAGFCALSACMIAKHSPLMTFSCMSCAEACKATAAEVGKFDSPQMKKAAEKLLACEKSCRAMAAEMKAHHDHAPKG